MPEEVIPKSNKQINQIIDHFFRYEYGKVSSYLVSKFGASYIEIIEDSVQESLIKAMQIWPYRGIPENPEGWILRVATNTLIDQLRKSKNFESKKEFLSQQVEEKAEIQEPEGEIKDDVLKMMFALCHPEMSLESQIILTLKIICGFNSKETARALLKSESAIIKAYTRGKAKFKSINPELIIPSGEKLENTVTHVLKIIYLIFNEGYNSIDENLLIKRDLCAEAIRLAELLLDIENIKKNKIHGLLALMYFHASRFDSRINEQGELTTLDKQNRELWDKELISLGRYHIEKAYQSEDINEYLIEASISGLHCEAKSYETTKWDEILNFYNLLIQIKPHQNIFLNRLICLSKAEGNNKALKELKDFETKNKLLHSKNYFMIKAYLHEENNNIKESIFNLKNALELTHNKIEQKFIRNKVSALNQNTVLS